MIPLINEAFDEDFSEDANVMLKPAKQVTQLPDATLEQNEMDAVAEVSDMSHDTVSFHFEVETWPDENIAVRLAEYDAAEAYAGVERTKGGAIMTLPRSAVIFLRSRESVPNDFTITIRYSGGEASYKVPVIKVKDYSVEEIFKKRL